MERDPTLATIDDITEEEANITIPEVLPSSSGRSTSSTEYSAFAARLQRHRRGAYRKRLSRSREEISASSRSRESAQTADDTSGTADSDNDSLASCDVFANKDQQIEFLKQTLIETHNNLQTYKTVNLDLSKKLEKFQMENKGLKKQIQDILWDKYVLYDKYKKLKERFGIVDSPSGDDDSPGSNNSGPSGAGRVATPVRRPKKRGDSPAGPRDGAGPSKVRPRVMHCGLDREVMESASDVSSADELGDSGFCMADLSHSAKSCYDSDADGSSSRSDSQCSLQSALIDQDVSSNPDPSNDAQSENDVVPSDVSLSECSLQSALIDQDVSRNLDGSNDAQSENDVPSHVSPSEDEEQYNEVNIVEDDEVANDETADPDLNQHDNDINPEEDDVGSIGTRRTSASRDEQQVEGEERHEDNGSDASLQSEQVRNGGEVDTESDKSSERSSISRKRSRSSTSLSLSDGDSGGSKRRKSSSTDSSETSHSDTSGASSDRSLPVRPSRSQSRSPSPQLPFRDSPGVIPGAPMPAGTRKLPRYWQRDGNDVRRRFSQGEEERSIQNGWSLYMDGWRFLESGNCTCSFFIPEYLFVVFACLQSHPLQT